jgi:competence protein ComEA
MKRIIQSYLSFNRTERMGIVALIVILVAFIATKLVLNYSSATPSQQTTTKQNTAIAALSQQSASETKYSQSAEPNVPANTIDIKTAEDNKTEQIKLTPFPFDPNTLDSAGFRKMGLSSKTTGILMNWRVKGKHFYRAEDLKPLYTLKPEQFGTLAPYIRISKISLNKADSATLVRLRGIGPKLAHRILEKRQQEPFTDIEELRSLQRIPDTVYTQLAEIITID